MSTKQKINIFWFRRDLRLADNTAFFHALKAPFPVLPLFIFETHLLSKLEDEADARLNFIWEEVCRLFQLLTGKGGNLLIDWRWEGTWFVRQLLNYELTSNKCGWQWTAGSSLDAQIIALYKKHLHA